MSKDKVSKEERLLGAEVCGELQAISKEALEAVIVQANSSIKQAKDELEANPKYQEICELKKALSGGFTDLKKVQNAKIQYALRLREEKSL